MKSKLPSQPPCTQQNADKDPNCAVVNPCLKNKTVIWFRPLSNFRTDVRSNAFWNGDYHGEFGFDWLREQESPTEEAAYQAALVGYYKSGQISKDKTQAYQALQHEYEYFTLQRECDNRKNETYFVPYLSLFDEETVQKIGKTYPALAPILPQSEATLRLLKDIKDSSARHVLVCATSEHLCLNGQKQLDMTKDLKGITPNNEQTRQQISPTLTISCKKALQDDEAIYVFAIDVLGANETQRIEKAAALKTQIENSTDYHALAKNPPDGITVAGKINVKANAKIKVQDCIFVSTSIPDIDSKKSTSENETKLDYLRQSNEGRLFHYSFYQARIIPNIINETFTLDFMNDIHFVPSDLLAKWIQLFHVVDKSTGKILIVPAKEQPLYQQKDAFSATVKDGNYTLAAPMIAALKQSILSLDSGWIGLFNTILSKTLAFYPDRNQMPKSVAEKVKKSEKCLVAVQKMLNSIPDEPTSKSDYKKAVKLFDDIYTELRSSHEWIVYGRFRLGESFAQNSDYLYLFNVEREFNRYVVATFKEKYQRDGLIIFNFNAIFHSNGGKILGYVHNEGGNFLKRVSLFKGRIDNTFSHEMLHAFGLRHTHDDGKAHKDAKYLYHDSYFNKRLATSNVMSYQRLGYITWHWQWEIMREQVDNHLK